MKILIVKLSSLGDVVHAMPAVQDMLASVPGARVDWVVERSFAALVRRCQGVHRVIECDIRRWRKSPLSAQTRSEWRAFRQALREQAYDAVIDVQGLTKSALVARTARLAAAGKRFALANQTEGSSYEAPTRWVADVAIHIEPHVHAVERSRELCARALGYVVPPAVTFGLQAQAPQQAAQQATAQATQGRPCVAFVHGTSRDDKLWPEALWVQLGQRLIGEGFSIGLPHGSDGELARSERIASALGQGGPQGESEGARVWPRMDLGALTDRLAACAGVIGVDSGLSHIAVALDLPHVQIYNFDTAWRTGPPASHAKQRSVFAQPAPSLDAVWQVWTQVRAVR
ncbi:lipopolysaccharide heptosyltransferase I [Caenimonas koreensis]|uniref:lipopolysaccharide heptosyltransferase I n=1 Tax=Caenimonas koreensis TaxID=367474 RepID=UPI0037846447